MIEKLKNDSIDDTPIKGKGGARPGAGRHKGGQNESTKLRAAAKQDFQRRVVATSDNLFNAQYDLAIGEKYLMLTETVGKSRDTSIVTDTELIIQFINGTLENTDTEYYFMTTKPANNQALDSLLNRAYGKPDEKLEVKGDILPDAHKLSTEDIDERIRRYFERHKHN